MHVYELHDCTRITSNYIIKILELYLFVILGAVVEIKWGVPTPSHTS